MSTKRPRTPSQSGSRSSSPSPEPVLKASRTYQPSSSSSSGSPNFASTIHPLLCTLPPTCDPPHNKPTPIADSNDLETHYVKYHAHVCEERGCRCIFPDARLLELHQVECHDPIAAIRKDRGEKIFACHLVSCPRLFLTPKTRRLHLIQAHGYPKEYFFAVTNKGIGGLLKRWGEGASMVRKSWKKREAEDGPELGNSDEAELESVLEESSFSAEQDTEDTPKVESISRLHEDSTSASTNNDGLQVHNHYVSQAPSRKAKSKRPQNGESSKALPPASSNADDLAQSMSSLSLVPPSIRFGRGGKSGGFVSSDTHITKTATPPPTAAAVAQETRGHDRGRGGRGVVIHPHTNGHHIQPSQKVPEMSVPNSATSMDVDRKPTEMNGPGPPGLGLNGVGRGGLLHVSMRGFGRGRGRGGRVAMGMGLGGGRRGR